MLSPSFTEQMPELLSEQYVQTSADEVQKVDEIISVRAIRPLKVKSIFS